MSGTMNDAYIYHVTEIEGPHLQLQNTGGYLQELQKYIHDAAACLFL